MAALCLARPAVPLLMTPPALLAPHAPATRKRRFSDDDAYDSDASDASARSAVLVHDASAPRYAATSADTSAATKHRITHFSEAQVQREAAAYLARVGRRSGRANIFDL
jgi:hypothetical protein